MSEIIKETIAVQAGATPAPVVVAATPSDEVSTQKIEYLVYFIFGFIEILLSFRLVLKLLGASTSSGFVRVIYGVTGIFIMPFEGIFRRMMSQGIETTSVLEPSTLVAIFVYITLAWGIVQLIRVFSREQQS